MPGTAATGPLPYGSALPWSARLLAFVESSHRRACAILLALSLLCFLPGLASLQPMDRDEPRFAQATKQMLETGDYVDIRFQDEVRYKKPIGIHWMQAATVAVAEAGGASSARTAIGIYRIPSALGAVAAVLLTYWTALAFLTRRDAFLAAALIGSSLILAVEARLAKTDAVLLACCVAAFGGLARAYLGRFAGRQPARTAIIFWAALALGVLVKGPMIALFIGLPAAFLSLRERSLAWLGALRPGLGVVAVAAVALPWFGAIAWKSGGEFYRLAVGDDLLGKVTTGQQKHGAPPGFYLVSFFATFWPGAILAAIAAPFAWRERREDRVAFALASILPAWALFELFPTKLPHYLMPVYPVVAILTVLAISRDAVGPHRPGARFAFAAMPLIPAGITAGLCYAAWILDGAVPVAALPILLAATAVSLAAWIAFNRGEVVGAALTGAVASVLLSLGVFGLAQPVLASLKLSPRLAEVVGRAACPNPVVATLGYREPSLVFLVGTGLDMLEQPAEAAAFLAEPGCRVALVDSRFEAAFRSALGREPGTLARIRGFNINGGRIVEIGAFTPPAQP
jgi:4-amino-4-deoxy-L-arabinose transferase-like glycosyltransferase